LLLDSLDLVKLGLEVLLFLLVIEGAGAEGVLEGGELFLHMEERV
jgi:hypothetical protein